MDAAVPTARRGWSSEIVPMLEATPGIRAGAVFEEICRRHPEMAPGVRRTMERRTARWRALDGPSCDVIFPPGAPAGAAALSVSVVGRSCAIHSVIEKCCGESIVTA